MSQITNPIRYPDVRSTDSMTKRAWWLVVLNVVLPGSAQILAGNRRLGRFGLGSTFAFIALAVVALVVYRLWPEVLLTIFTNNLGLWVAALALLFYGALWLVLTLDTLRLVRLVRTAPRVRAVIAALTAAVMLIVCGTAGYGAYVATTASGFLSDVFTAGPTEPSVDGRYNVLLLGGDAGADRDGLRPDSISVVSVEADTGQATMISLPRNLEDVPFSDGSALGDLYPDGYGAINGCDTDACILNSVYTEAELKRPFLYPDADAQGSSPGIEATKEAAEGITGLTIQYYVLIDMQGFSDLVDALGGVDIDVQSRVPVHEDETFTSVAFWFEPGMQHMDGYHALWFARSRHGTSDYDRINRQRQLQEALLAQASPANVLTQFQGVAKAGREVVKTDVPQGMLGYFVNLASKTKALPIEGVALTPESGVDPENPDYSDISALIDAALAPPAKDAPAG